MGRIKLVFWLYLLLGILPQAFARRDQQAPSVPLHEFRKWQGQDDLESWIYAWIDTVAADPANRSHWVGYAREHAWRAPRNNEEEGAWFFMLVNEGYFLLQYGNIGASVAAYEQAYRYAAGHKSVSGNDLLEYVLKPLGNNYTRLGDYERALFIQSSGLAIARDLGDPLQEAAMCNNLAASARWQGDAERADAYCRQGLSRVPRTHPLAGLLLTTRADLAFSLADTFRAESYIRQALPLLQRSSTSGTRETVLWYCSALQVAGRIAASRTDNGRAQDYYKKALALLGRFFPDSRRRDKAKLWVSLGDCAAGRTSVAAYEQALSLLLPGGVQPLLIPDSLLYPENTLLDAYAGIAGAWQRLGDAEAALQHFRKSFTVAGKLRRSFSGGMSKARLQQQMLEIAGAAMDVSYDLYRVSGNDAYAELALDIAERHKAGVLADELQRQRARRGVTYTDSLGLEEERLERLVGYYERELTLGEQGDLQHKQRIRQELSQTRYELSLLRTDLERRYPALRMPDESGAASLLAALPGDVTLYAYTLAGVHAYLFVAGANGVRQFIRIGAADSISARVSAFTGRFFYRGAAAQQAQPEAYCRDAYALFRTLFPVAPVPGSRTLIIPDGVLSLLPFEALITDDRYSHDISKWPYLLYAAQVSYGYSLRVWRLQQQSVAGHDGTGFSGFFIPAGGPGGFSDLPAIYKEEEALKQVIRGDFFFSEKATMHAFLEAIPRSRILHISTHALLSGTDRLPVIRLADSLVLFSDLYRLRRHPELTVLNACRTADGTLVAGEGVLSFSRAFATIGSGGIVSVLWNMNDEAGAGIMSEYYRRLLQTGDKSGALHAAKRHWLEREDLPMVYKLPYYWSGPVYTGDLNPMSLKGLRPVQIPVVVWVIAGFLVAAAGIFIGRSLIKGRK